MPEKEKNDDEMWLLRKVLSRPNYAVVMLLFHKSPRTAKELYMLLEKRFTRKTLIITLRDLSLNFNVIQPTHIRTDNGYGLGYKLNPKVKLVIKTIQKCAKTFEGIQKE